MGQTSQWYLSREIQAGFFSPVDSLKFFARHKFLLVMGLAPHVLGLAAYLWLIIQKLFPFLQRHLEALTGLNPAGWAENFFLAGLIILGLITYTLVGLPILSVLASPLWDVVAEKAYVEATGRPLPKLKFNDFVRSFLSECSKTILVLGCLVLAFFLPWLAPLGFIVSIWFFGWDHMDRTLSLKGLSLGPRLLFGVQHAPACLSLGIWAYVPFAGTLLSFVMTAAGALTVAKVEGAATEVPLAQAAATPGPSPKSQA